MGFWEEPHVIAVEAGPQAAGVEHLSSEGFCAHPISRVPRCAHRHGF